MQKIITHLWFDDQAEQAADFYTSVFDDGRIVEVLHYGEAGPGVAGSVMTVRFELFGQQFVALNGGPYFTFNEAISLHVSCDSQQEVDRLWSALTEGGAPVQCGWLKDRFGVSWQIVPTALYDMLRDPDPARSARVTRAMLGMTKLDVRGLRQAYEQDGAHQPVSSG